MQSVELWVSVDQIVLLGSEIYIESPPHQFRVFTRPTPSQDLEYYVNIDGKERIVRFDTRSVLSMIRLNAQKENHLQRTLALFKAQSDSFFSEASINMRFSSYNTPLIANSIPSPAPMSLTNMHHLRPSAPLDRLSNTTSSSLTHSTPSPQDNIDILPPPYHFEGPNIGSNVSSIDDYMHEPYDVSPTRDAVPRFNSSAFTSLDGGSNAETTYTELSHSSYSSIPPQNPHEWSPSTP